mmetsp:Transcript_611/g.1187  ORF Transcript_611/g.1187 Transcript_611/m.1187 type:complete len:238 (+) Transcript_611:317-1030(+)
MGGPGQQLGTQAEMLAGHAARNGAACPNALAQHRELDCRVLLQALADRLKVKPLCCIHGITNHHQSQEIWNKRQPRHRRRREHVARALHAPQPAPTGRLSAPRVEGEDLGAGRQVRGATIEEEVLLHDVLLVRLIDRFQVRVLVQVRHEGTSASPSKAKDSPGDFEICPAAKLLDACSNATPEDGQLCSPHSHLSAWKKQQVCSEAVGSIGNSHTTDLSVELQKPDRGQANFTNPLP